MPPPRQNLPGQTLHVVRRTSERRSFLTASPAMAACQEFAFAVAIEESKQTPHASVFMNTHHHTENTDHDGTRSIYSERLHGILGYCGNCILKRTGHFWDNRRTAETVLLHDPEVPALEDEELENIIDDVLREVAIDNDLDIYQLTALYIWMNPISANLVDQVRQFPGFTVLPKDWGETYTVQRPEGVKEGYPDRATYSPKPPPGKWSQMSLEDAKADANALIAQAEDLYRKKRHREGKRVLGPKALRCMNPFGTPNESPKSRRNRRKPTPRFSGNKKQVEKANRAYATYRDRHRVAGRKFRGGQRDVRFPAGAVGMQRIAGVTCRPRPLPDEDPMP